MDTFTENSATLIFDKNKVASSYPWVILMEVQINDTDTIYIARNNEDIIYNSGSGNHTYTAFPFDIGAAKQVSKGEIPSLELSVSNVTLAIQAYIEADDGMVGRQAIMRLVYIDTSGGYPYSISQALVWTYTILGCKSTAMLVTFTLGAPNPLFKRYPLYRYIAAHCNWIFTGAECNYTSTMQLWTKTHKYYTGDMAKWGTITARCWKSGVSGSVVTFTTVRQQKVKDGTVTWLLNVTQTFKNNYPYLKGDLIDPGNGHLYRCDYGTDETIGDDGNNYYCIQNIPANAAHTNTTRPIHGTIWTQYWRLGGTNGTDWFDNQTYTFRASQAAGNPTWTTKMFSQIASGTVTFRENTCKRTLGDCEDLHMANRYGGQPGLSRRGVTLASV